ncbi:MAG: hypothetical protein Q7J22_00315 [Candidatus Wolfebacteria bacterium]|nr:hypothetical protein [Candidatus Wolfebacteria bacterium]
MQKLVWFIVLVVLIGGAVYLLRGNFTEKRDEMSATSTPEEAVPLGAGMIVYTDGGFSPSPLTVKAGETVTFKNESGREVWPASAMHPTHTGYPGSDIEKCDSAAPGEMFDACGPVMAGESWGFQFNEVGEWAYHDHLNTSYFGKVVVE